MQHKSLISTNYEKTEVRNARKWDMIWVVHVKLLDLNDSTITIQKGYGNSKLKALENALALVLIAYRTTE